MRTASQALAVLLVTVGGCAFSADTTPADRTSTPAAVGGRTPSPDPAAGAGRTAKPDSLARRPGTGQVYAVGSVALENTYGVSRAVLWRAG
ncbi:hypothetical protein [Nonomuraea sp. NPDC048826]|uniref:hypothetical protein n=1 Tax=Nonomuraea sp. NPDC048826 TaxID=3364347 RepID=UPI003718554B